MQVHYAEVRAIVDRSLELVEQATRHLASLGTVAVFIPKLAAFRADDRLHEASNELRRMQIALDEAQR
jgi:hypothetical protein